MASFEKEKRSEYEAETLVFETPEEAQGFKEKVKERVESAPLDGLGVNNDREVVAEVVAEEMAQQGYAPEDLSKPWLHTETEHAEAQALADEAFAGSLKGALAAAQKSASYPRNIDLLHDVLVDELYPMVVEERLNKPSVSLFAMLIAIVALTALITVGLLLAL